MPPSPPFSQTLESANSHPLASQNSLTYASSASLSVTNSFNVTTHGTPNLAMFSMCFSRFTIPAFNASRFSSDKSSFLTPPLYLRARTVATSTTASGFKSAIRHLMSKNFSAPKSAPKPASVIV